MDRRGRLLVIDDDVTASDWLVMVVGRLGFEATVATSGEQALEDFTRRRPKVVTVDFMLPGINGIETLKALRAVDPNVPIIMLSGHGQTRTIVEAVRNGATDFLRKPFEEDEIEAALEKALKPRPASRPNDDSGAARAGEMRGSSVLGEAPRMRAISDAVDRVADTDITVLVSGESGTGKELVAQLVHQKSERRTRPFVKVNCAALPSELLESELFGYEKGAFTGAQRRKLGKFELAHNGSIFLDEISEIPLSLQAKLLQVLQDGQFARLGGERDVEVDARVIAATNRNLEEAVRAKTFREDLFYRLNVVTIRIPPLRERREEIPRLTEQFLRRYSLEYGKPYRAPSATLMEAFMAYRWSGNVRELENLVRRLIVLGTEQPVLAELETRRAKRQDEQEPSTGANELQRFIKGEVDRVSLKRIAREASQAAERRLIERVLNLTRWNRRQTAEILQVSYKALLYKMKDAGLANRA